MGGGRGKLCDSIFSWHLKSQPGEAREWGPEWKEISRDLKSREQSLLSPVDQKRWQLSCKTEDYHLWYRDGGSVLRHKENSPVSPVLGP